ncbi:TRAP transporter small permease [Aliiroseovarius crassostreae]|uniref:TRAP transporter small permease n=1 Tax=Aliiroseovarius crassostreae TaxID=154981 RepID=UPI00220E3AD9|nr:TRAP transporter small permease subunit [Aliiroseovarius crassostreae]UWQ04920.1 TRAP transporter small permease subunit [Aliiroseovarius crassostreae]
MEKILKWFSRLAEAIAGGLLAAIFLTFLLQIALRYLFTPAGWTLELIGILWVWVIFFSCAFVVREQDQVKFDIIYLSVNKPVRRIFALISAVALVVGMLYTLLPTWDYIDWMKIRKTSTVRNPFTGNKIPLRDVFSIYGVFIVAIAIRYAWLFIDVLRNGPPKTELELAVDAIHEAEVADAAEDTKEDTDK